MTISARRTVATAAAVATAAVGTLATVPAAHAAERSRITDYGFTAYAYGTSAKADQPGLRSGRSAPAQLACTRKAGVGRDNTAAGVAIPPGQAPAFQVSGIDNQSRTYQTRRKVGSKARSTIAEVVIGPTDGPHLLINALRTRTDAFAKRGSGKLGARSTFDSGEIDAQTGNAELDGILDGADLDVLTDQIRANGPIEIPGVAEVRLGNRRNKVRSNQAVSEASALRATLYGQDQTRGTADDARVVVGKARSAIYDDVTAGIMHGRAVPIDASLLGGTVKVGRVTDKPLPCPGTNGKVRSTATTGLNLANADQLEAARLNARVFGVQREAGSARAWTEARVVSATLGGGQIVVEGVVGRATVKTNRKGRIRGKSTKGTTIGSLTVNGEEHALPDPGQAVEIPGVATIEYMVTEKRTRGLTVTALRVTLLDDTAGDSVINLGRATTYIKRS